MLRLGLFCERPKIIAKVEGADHLHVKRQNTSLGDKCLSDLKANGDSLEAIRRV
jgi:hypothetical protein